MGLFSKISSMIDNGELKKYRRIADKVVALESEYKALSDEALQAKTTNFKNRVAEGESLDSLLPEAFAAVREAAGRVRGMTPFYVQIMGGIILHEGNIAEMKTGEGKTLTAMMPAYLNALAGQGVHIVTVNEYLASRDSVWMGDILRFLGLSVGLVVREQTPSEKREAYACDVTYATNNELGFDYLRDNMAMRIDDLVQRELSYAIVDEVDSILIDEARTPLIISGSGKESTQEYQRADIFVRRLTEGEDNDFKIDEKAKTATLTEAGISRAEQYFSVENLMDIDNIELLHHINQALKANFIMKRDVDYVVNDGEIVIVDEFTGRLMPGRRYNEGLHQAIEAKERMKVNRESVTMATITFQNFFRMYGKLSGMTGTAKTEENEFKSIYGMDVICVPTNKPMIRDDMNDLVYRTEAGKFNAVVDEIERRHALGQPMLVGTISIEKSEYLSRLLTKRRIPHTVLNAKNHKKEAEIISQAGQMNAVTISTNMAGRGTDIVLGDGVVGLGGLHVIGTERHESRRIDNQLRGRSGRQGDPGSSQFYISLEDDLMRLFGSERMQALVSRVGMDDSTAIEAGILTKGIEGAQKNVEGRNFGIRKSVLQYDDVMNKQREVIYEQRKKVLRGEDISEQILDMIEKCTERIVALYTSTEDGSWDIPALTERLNEYFGVAPEFPMRAEPEEMIQLAIAAAKERRKERIAQFGEPIYLALERAILLRVVDSKWMEHIDNMDQLRTGIGLRAYGQTNPITAYTKEGFEMFEDMNANIVDDTVRSIYHFTIREESRTEEKQKKAPALMTNQVKEAKVMPAGHISKNAPCPCGSGKKYKRCCGKDKFND